jgi:hypothetical protein
MDASLVEDSEVWWTREGQGTWEKRTSLEVVGREEQRVEHRVEGVTEEDQGHYRCHARTSFDEAVSKVAVLGIKHGTEITRPPVDWEAEIGEEAEFQCRVTTDPSLRPSLAIAWLRDGVEVELGPRALVTEGGARLVLRVLTPGDAGRLQCRATTTADTVTSGPGVLTVVRPTAIVEGSAGGLREVVEGAGLTLECRAETDPSVEESLVVEWEVAGVTLESGDSRLRGEGPGHLDLKLRGEEKDSGSYQCVARTSRDEARAAVVEVAVRQATVASGPASETLRLEGDTLWLECLVKVDVALKASLAVSWLRDGEVVARQAALVVDSARPADSGAYTCVAETRLDRSESGAAPVTVYPRSTITEQPRAQMLLAGGAHSLRCRCRDQQ